MCDPASCRECRFFHKLERSIKTSGGIIIGSCAKEFEIIFHDDIFYFVFDDTALACDYYKAIKKEETNV